MITIELITGLKLGIEYLDELADEDDPEDFLSHAIVLDLFFIRFSLIFYRQE